MLCDENTLLASEFLKSFRERIYKDRIPVSGSIDLTHRCNLRCIHCYLSGSDVSRVLETPTDRVLGIIDEAADAGCLFLLLTGGEPLLREDFPVIYRHAKMCGMLITVFTNGTLITEEIVRLFSEYPPKTIEISLYGSNSSVYEAITGVSGSYERCMRGIRMLHENGVSMRLKTILMANNKDDFPMIEETARSFNAKFRFDPAIFTRNNGDRSPLELRVEPDYAVEREFSDSQRAESWKDYYLSAKDLPTTERIYSCGAGSTGFHIDAYGNLKPCIMVSHISYNLCNGSFKEGWENVICRIRDKKADIDSRCPACDKRHLCGYCPAFSRLEHGSEYAISDYLCKMGHRRLDKIKETLMEVNIDAG